jgi:ABC-type cobalamin/Fe3+-siderophores transport system ATPase subunit
VQAPSIYLLDEPTNHLDPAQQLGILERLHGLTRQGAAVIASLHDPNLRCDLPIGCGCCRGPARVTALATAELEAGHLAGLYGIDYVETRLGDSRFMAPGFTAPG